MPVFSPLGVNTVPADGSITSAKIADGTIVNDDISASAAIAQSKVSGLTSDLAAKAPADNPSFTGTVTIPDGALAIADTSGLQAALDAKAPLASPALTGTPTVPTASAGTNTTQAASTAFVRGEVAALVASAPGALDTLDELAAALGDDASFAATMTSALALKAPLASPALTGNPTAPTPSAGDNDTSIATTAFVNGNLRLPIQLTQAAYDALVGGPVSGQIYFIVPE